MYDWQAQMTPQTFRQGSVVRLNPEWSMYPFLNENFGHLFPRPIEKLDGDLVHFKVGKQDIVFATQTLMAAPRRKH